MPKKPNELNVSRKQPDAGLHTEEVYVQLQCNNSPGTGHLLKGVCCMSCLNVTPGSMGTPLLCVGLVRQESRPRPDFVKKTKVDNVLCCAPDATAANTGCPTLTKERTPCKRALSRGSTSHSTTDRQPKARRPSPCVGLDASASTNSATGALMLSNVRQPWGSRLRHCLCHARCRKPASSIKTTPCNNNGTSCM